MQHRERRASEPYRFETPLVEGIVRARPNRFIMDVELPASELSTVELAASRPAERKGYRILRCHCPVVSRIGRLDTAGRPCLVSTSENPRRKFSRTVEAISLDEPSSPRKTWIGINQTASNRYVEHFLSTGELAPVHGGAGCPDTLRREVPLGASRLDFLVNDAVYLEVKTPLVQLQLPLPPHVATLGDPPFSSTDRALRHLRELAASLATQERASVLYCFYYDNPGFRFYHGTTYDEVRRTVEAVRGAGVELWQANFAFTPNEITLAKLHPLELVWDEAIV